MTANRHKQPDRKNGSTENSVTGRKKREEAFTQGETHYRLLFENSSEAVLLTAPDGTVFSANPAACRMFHRTGAEICSLGRNGLIDVTDPRLPDALRERIETGRFKGELTGMRADGQKFPCEVSSAIFKDHDGQLRTSMIIHDITERKRLEEVIRETNAYNRSLIETSLDPFISIGLKGEITDVNAATELVTGYSRQELIGTFCSDYLSDPGRAKAGYKIVFAEGFVRDYELEIRHRDGHLTPVLCSASLYKDVSGTTMGIVVVARDVTERKKMEEALYASEQTISMIADNVPALVAYIDGEGYYRYANRRYEEWFGIPTSAIIGKHFLELLGKDVYKRIRPRVQAALSGRYVSFEDYLPYAHGCERWVYAQYVPDIGNDGEVKGFFGLVTDITERRRVEESLSRSMMQFENMVKNVPGIIYKFAVHPDGSMTFPYISDNARNLGLDPHRVMKNSQELLDVIDPDDLPGLMQSINASARSLQTWSWEGRFIVSGEKRWYKGISQPSRLADGTVEWDGLITDITEQKQMVKRLEEIQQFSLSTIDALTAHIAVLDEEGTIIAVNNNWRKSTGHNSPVLVNVNEGANYISVCDAVQGDYSKEAAAFGAGIRSVINGDKEMFSLEYPCHAPGEPRWFIGTVTRFHGEGNIRVVVAHENITERKKAEEALKLSEKRYRDLFENALEGIYQTTPEGRYINVNPSFAHMFGYSSPEEMMESVTDIGKQLYVDTADRERLREELSEKGHVEEFTAQMRRKDCSTFWISINGHVVRDQNGVILYYEGTNMDVTERKRAEEAIRLSEERFKNLYQESPIPTFTWQKRGEDFILVDFNRAMVNITGGRVGEYLGSRAMRLYGDRPEVFDNMVFCYKERSVVRKEFVSRNFAPGRLFSVCYGFIPPDLIIISMEDITEQKRVEAALRESEQRYRILTEKTIAGIYLIQDGLFKYVNPTFCDIHGYTGDELIDKMSPLDLVVEEEREFLNDKILERLSGERESDQFSLRIRRRDGEIRFLEVFSSFALYAGEPAVLGTCIDMTETRKANEAIRKSQEELRALTAYLQNVREEERIRIAREVHDELGQALTSMKIDISWLKKSLADKVKPADPIQMKIDSLLTLTESAIVTTRELSLSLRPGILDDLGLVTAIKWQMRRLADKAGIVYAFHSDVAETAIPEEYVTPLFRICQECLTNITRHAQATEANIMLTEEGGSLILQVEDNGKGITAKQVKSPLSLGLLGMRERVINLRGRFSMGRSPGGGTKVRVELPAKERS